MCQHACEDAGIAQEVFRRSALEQLRGRMQGSLKRANASATADMDRLLEQQAELTRRDREVSAGVDAVQVGQVFYSPCSIQAVRLLLSLLP